MKTVRFRGHREIQRPDGSGEDSWREFVCGCCDVRASAAIIARFQPAEDQLVLWLQCPNCGNGSVIDPEDIAHPAPRFGPAIEGVPEPVASAYGEARDCMSVAAYWACELICRNILMYVAVDKGAKEGDTFAAYVDYLAEQGYVTPPMRPWVDQIRKIGNLAAHELEGRSAGRAEGTVMFTAELLRLVYEMETMTAKYAPSPGSVASVEEP